jgi:hypothetical protein
MTLDAALLAAHAGGDKPALVTLYTAAADQAGGEAAACFYLTQAYVFALEIDHPNTRALYLRLKAHGRV